MPALGLAPSVEAILPIAPAPLLCSITVAWAGDCRAVVGLRVPSPQGSRCLVHPLTQDHKPGRWAEAEQDPRNMLVRSF